MYVCTCIFLIQSCCNQQSCSLTSALNCWAEHTELLKLNLWGINRRGCCIFGLLTGWSLWHLWSSLTNFYPSILLIYRFSVHIPCLLIFLALNFGTGHSKMVSTRSLQAWSSGCSCILPKWRGSYCHFANSPPPLTWWPSVSSCPCYCHH